MTKKTEPKKQQDTTDDTKKQMKDSKEKTSANKKNTDSTKVETVRAKKVEKTSSSKPLPKYHFSINLSSNNSAPPSSKTETKPPSSSSNSTSKEKKSPPKANFAQETEAVRAAETLKPADVKHIRRSEQNKATILSSADPAAKKSDDKQPPKISPKVEKLKPSIDEIRSDPKAFKELQHLVKPSLLTKAKTEITKRVSLKYWAYSLVGIMKAIDLFISFITMPRGEGRNPALQKARSPVLFGLWVFFLFFIVGGFWAGLAPLDKAVSAQGFVVTTSKKQVVQHKEGGTLEVLYAKEGERVKKNQPLAKLEQTQAKAQLESFYSQKQESEKLLKITQEQLKALKDLEEKGFITKLKVIEQEVRVAEYKSKLSDINARIIIFEETLEKLVLKSPINGIVTQINVTTIGGTIGQGQAIMTITPSQEDLILEVYVRSQDIEPVHVGLKAKVNISAFRSKTTSYLEGVVTHVSPDVVDFVQQQGRQTQESFTLQRGQGTFYKVKISIDKAQLKKISKFQDYELVPGMDAQVQISIGERTLIQYLLDPILMTFWHAFKEK